MAQMFGMFVNDRIMKQLGLSVPQTWDELIADVPKIRAAGLTPLAWGNLARNVCSDFVLPLVTQYGGNVRALDDHTAPGVSWDSKPVIDALTLLQRLEKSGALLDGINGIDEQPAWRLAYEGKAAMLFAVSQAPKMFNAEAPKDSVHWTGGGSGEAWAISAKSPNKDLAVEFVKYMFQPDNYKAYAGTVDGFFPAMPSALPAVSDPKIKTMVSWMATDGSDHILFAPGSWDAVSDTCQGILDGSVEPADGAKQIEASVVAARAQVAK
jgi:ABC-type glycerol-3-phosphate transport system substrate-binding protein